MIRRGRSEGWLRHPIETLPTWAEFAGVKFHGIKIGPLPGFEDRGSTVIAEGILEGDKANPLLVIPKDLIISRQNIDIIAKSDNALRDVLEALGDFGRTTRGAVLTFLLLQATKCCPETKNVGPHYPLTEYIKFLPDELLPTFWTEEEQELLTGTTLKPAVRAKLNSLLREFETFRTATEPIEWCKQYWWDEDTGMVTFDDWMRVDAMYRSRALEFPGAGDCMMPCVDMANHASGDATAAIYETDEHGNGLLLLRPGKQIEAGGEVSITYGDDKGACENIFSYGFLEESMTSAKVMFLDLDIPDDDPLRPAKIFVSDAAPGCRIFEDGEQVVWESDFIWLVVINEEDGLDFKVMQTIDGKREIQAFWKDRELQVPKLKEHLQADEAWEVFQLRATVLLQQRVESQIELLHATKGLEVELSVRDGPGKLAEHLRTLELDMLQRAFANLDSQKSRLLESKAVIRYLGLAEDEVEEEDFS